MQNKRVTIIPSLNDQLIIQLNQLQNKYSKLLPIRIDLFYDKVSIQDGNANLVLAKEEIGKFILELSNHTNLDIVGYAIAMEYDSTKQIHFHCVFYVDGQKHTKYYPVYEVVSRLWCDMTGTTRLPYDCQRSDYIIDALKMIDYYDQKAYDNLCYALSYLAKREQKELFGAEYQDYLFLSSVPKPSGRGRPRRYVLS